MKVQTIYFLTRFFLITSILLYASSLHAQKMKSSGTNITVYLKDPSLKKHPLICKVISDYIQSGIGAKEITVQANSDGFYRLHLPDISGIAKFEITYQDLTETYLIDGYIEPSDNISIEFTGVDPSDKRMEDFKFSGRGSQNLIVRSILQSAIPNNRLRYADSPFDMKYLDKGAAYADSNYMFYKRILTSHKNSLSDPVFKVMDADLFGRANMATINSLAEFYNMYPQADVHFKDSILLYLPTLENKKFTGYSPFALQSQDYINYLYYKARGTSRLKYGSVKIQDVYNELVRQNAGQAREKVLLNFLTKSLPTQRGDNPQFVFSDALQYLQNPAYKKMVIELADKKKLGAKAYPFTLPDSSGKMVSLGDFKGKTLIVDCWFTGCSVCSDVAKIIDKYVLPKYVNNDNVVFISVNVDRSKELWKKSIKGGQYTNPKSINLYTEGLAQNHPFLKSYQFQGFPRLILIDKKGNIFSPSLTRNPNEMIELIDQALKMD